LSEVYGQAQEANDQVEDLTEQLDKCVTDLDETRQALLKAQGHEMMLQNELADMTSRAKDSEAVSKQRMELVQGTREKLKNSRTEVEELTTTKQALVADIKEWTEKTAAAEKLVEDLQIELTDFNGALERTRDQLTAAQDEVANLTSSINQLTSEDEDWKEKALFAESLADCLQEELVATREALNKTQQSLKVCHETEATMREDFTHAEHLMFELDDEVEAKTKANEEAEAKLEALRANKLISEKEFEALKLKLSARIEEESQLSNKYKQDLFHAQETLNEIQSSLGASQHCKKMLKHEVAKLQDKQQDLERGLEDERRNTSEAMKESVQSLDATREVLNAKAQKELEEVQHNMNQLLEDERRAKRNADEAYKKKLHQMREELEEQTAEIKKKASIDLQESKKAADDRNERLRKEYEEKISNIKTSSEQENDQLLSKGKGMLKDAQAKVKEELDELRDVFAALEEQLSDERKEKDNIAHQYKTKVAEYKKKLQFTTSRINSLSTDSDELEEKFKVLEREKFKLQEENERYRRQLGGRFGSDSKVQNQLEKVQKEFKNAIEEIQELRQQQHNKSGGGLASIHEDAKEADHSYSRDAVNQLTLVQLRTEYEETIEALNDHKRQLILSQLTLNAHVLHPTPVECC
jgi:chromosome segregation ATPase